MRPTCPRCHGRGLVPRPNWRALLEVGRRGLELTEPCPACQGDRPWLAGLLLVGMVIGWGLAIYLLGGYLRG